MVEITSSQKKKLPEYPGLLIMFKKISKAKITSAAIVMTSKYISEDLVVARILISSPNRA